MYHLDILTCRTFFVVSLVVESEGESLGILLDRGMLLASRGLAGFRSPGVNSGTVCMMLGESGCPTEFVSLHEIAGR
ncbi:unnamed protein product [Gulo gulo]|uniref:Uncharacterized protein n=1 Tax=Gulo gulo TaxID=48420 RepID=A0A9X9LMB8_GULGU|nr:unnamed protein product [Gulo gulo]